VETPLHEFRRFLGLGSVIEVSMISRLTLPRLSGLLLPLLKLEFLFFVAVVVPFRAGIKFLFPFYFSLGGAAPRLFWESPDKNVLSRESFYFGPRFCVSRF